MKASKPLYIFLAFATILAMGVSLAYSAGLFYQPTVSTRYNASYANLGLGLRLDLLVNSTHPKPGEGVVVTIRILNFRLASNQVQAKSDWGIRSLSLGPCGTVNQPIGFAIFRGNFTRNNIWAARPLQLYAPGLYSCPVILFGIQSYVFEPESNSAEILGSCGANPCMKMDMQGQGVFSGSWNELIPFSGTQVFRQFSPGVYTVAGGDEWGDLVFLNFAVF